MSEKTGWKKIWHVFDKWIKIPLEVVIFFGVVGHSVPDEWLKSGWFLFVLITIALLGLFIINYLLVLRLYNYEERIKKNLAVEVNQLNKDHEHQLLDLKTQISALEKKARYVEVFSMLNGAFQQLHHAVRKNHSDIRQYHEHLVVCCNNLERAFSTITSHECHVSIKMTQFPNETIPPANKAHRNVPNILLRTYCRSSSASSTRTQIDYKKNITHPVKENTDFEHIYANHDYFFCNDITQLESYKNSSLKDRIDSYIIHPKSLAGSMVWPLEYKAVLVAPISPIIKETKEDKIILGFLCIDCKVPGVFNEEYDKHIIIGCADGIYNSFYNIFNKPTVNHQ